VRLTPLASASLIELAAGWLAAPENAKWLDLGRARRGMSPTLLKLMTQKTDHALRIYTDDSGDRPIGVVGLDHIDRDFRTATVWVVLGDKAFARRGYATGAMSKMLTIGFAELGLAAINTWCVESNHSVRMVRQLNFRLVGRQRRCHYIDGQPCDRLLFDLLASEHRELNGVLGQAHA